MLSSASFTIEIEDKHEVGETKCNTNGENKVLQTLLVLKFLKGLVEEVVLSTFI